MPRTKSLLNLLALVPLVMLVACATPGGGGKAPADEEKAAPATETQPDSGENKEAQTPATPTQQEDATSESEANTKPQSAPKTQGLQGGNLYRLLVADLAGRQGNVGVALAGYLKAAKETSDPRVAKRATQLARYAGQDQAARAAGKRWVELAPDNPDAHAAMARITLKAGQREAAHQHLRQVIAHVDGGNKAGFERVTQLLSKSDDSEAALNVGVDLAADYPDSPASQLMVARLAQQAGANKRALTAVNQALALDSDQPAAKVLRAQIRVARGDKQDAFDDLARAVEEQPQSRTLALGYIRLLLGSGQRDKAVDAMQETFERLGDDAQSVYVLGLLAMKAEALDDAQIYLQRLVAMDARTAKAHYYLGRIQQQQGHCNKALRHYIRVGRGTHGLDAELRASVCLARVGRLDEARMHLQRLAESRQKETVETRITLTRARVERIGGHSQRALKILSDAVEAHPEQADLRFNRAMFADRNDRFELARTDLRRLLDNDPDSARALNALGYMLADRDMRLDEAHEMIKRALDQNPDNGAMLDSMGWVLYRQGKPEQALKYLRRAWRQHPDPEVAAHYGELLWVTGDHARARAIWQRGHELDPDDAVLKKTRARLTQ